MTRKIFWQWNHFTYKNLTITLWNQLLLPMKPLITLKVNGSSVCVFRLLSCCYIFGTIFQSFSILGIIVLSVFVFFFHHFKIHSTPTEFKNWMLTLVPVVKRLTSSHDNDFQLKFLVNSEDLQPKRKAEVGLSHILVWLTTKMRIPIICENNFRTLKNNKSRYFFKVNNFLFFMLF